MNPFPMIADSLYAEEIPLSEIAEKYGTPCYVYSQSYLIERAQRFSRSLEGAGKGKALIAFAVKANPSQAVLATLASQGLGADVVSAGEIKRAIAAGIPAERIVFSGVGKTAEEMAYALDIGIGQFNIESIPEIEMLADVAAVAGKIAPIALRINPDVDAKTHAKIATGKADTKFGIAAEQALEAYNEAARYPTLKVKGIASHIGSQITDLAPFEAAAQRIHEIITLLEEAGHTITTADLGGGLGVKYSEDQPEPPTPEEYGNMVRRATAGWNCQLIFEPGRAIIANAGLLLSKVIRVKESKNARFVVVDAAMNDLIRPTLYEAFHEIRAVTPKKGVYQADIVGPVCETGDIFAHNRMITPLKANDLIAIMSAGAYGATMASAYNSRPLVAEVMVSGKKSSLIRKRQSVEDLMRDELRPFWDNQQ
ncbi:MAG: diaminopimelate decarboxylase [Zymomonas mobilis subsp. pomaceae]|uniref:Diaminopimelate decarboxylase n=1 Tax=Zymomonas mobilis subsp. pomaceae (strain ATCC 29192 / DSM 22645 / JCM 10191 / CCUG 17912 / NBRC 13757 / NCIMB 11200 / NRRL B-4491 / Barker I) TaxID=579138 RepID=F8EV32_ZYMMT|nr:diaminopimelate decarboxylase [Zymomonas mobilis]AEI38250.1 diaminopimelate decarboxylase [Zymomonas mobilis subsp. pomaceae ATCC 29192]MDX5947939.1 diaminopimelate decarboxylase [Zymomonas mobilis subsp. pomaceae]GEB89268.1 diaminopimelate decarboxylase [Zymomonas mobilis subsp. pomaceae]